MPPYYIVCNVCDVTACMLYLAQQERDRRENKLLCIYMKIYMTLYIHVRKCIIYMTLYMYNIYMYVFVGCCLATRGVEAYCGLRDGCVAN